MLERIKSILKKKDGKIISQPSSYQYQNDLHTIKEALKNPLIRTNLTYLSSTLDKVQDNQQVQLGLRVLIYLMVSHTPSINNITLTIQTSDNVRFSNKDILYK